MLAGPKTGAQGQGQFLAFKVARQHNIWLAVIVFLLLSLSHNLTHSLSHSLSLSLALSLLLTLTLHFARFVPGHRFRRIVILRDLS